MRNDGILRIYTDGGCAGNQSQENLGGWGAILEFTPVGAAGTAGSEVAAGPSGSGDATSTSGGGEAEVTASSSDGGDAADAAVAAPAAVKELYGSEANTTNNRMEMTALLEAFRAIKKDGQRIQVFSDSSYLMDCFRKKWYVNWQSNGWKTSQKKPVENQDLWEALLPYLDRHEIEFYRVKGHVNLNSENIDLMKLYVKFCEWNGGGFTLDEFRYITEKNNRADKLANIGIDEIR